MGASIAKYEGWDSFQNDGCRGRPGRACVRWGSGERGRLCEMGHPLTIYEAGTVAPSSLALAKAASASAVLPSALRAMPLLYQASEILGSRRMASSQAFMASSYLP